MSIHDRPHTRTLNEAWEFAVDPDDAGVDDRWFESDTGWEESRSVSVPHSWQEEADLRTYTGVGWYRRTVAVESVASSNRTYLSFGAVDYEVTVWVNGTRIGLHVGGYLPFSFDATDALVEGENTVVLRVFDPEDLSEIPHGKQGKPWYTRVSGPWQSVGLVTVPETHVVDVRATPDLERAEVELDVTVEGDIEGDPVRATVTDDGGPVADGTATVKDGSATITLSIPDPDRWTPESPTLYDFEVSLESDGEAVDTYEDYFGMRSIGVRDGDLWLNGEPFQMRGALDQAYYPETLYRPADLDTFEKEVRTAKELGFNLLRKHIKPAHPRFLELADRLGMLVWEEPANPDVYTDASKQAVQAQFEALVARDYNRPSVVVWSLYNEEWGIGGVESEESLWTDREKQTYLESFYQDARELDPTRLVCDNSGWAHVATDLNDYHEYFVAPDRVDAWRDRLDEIVDVPEGNYGDARTDPEASPILVSEFGTWGLPTLSGVADRDESEPHWFSHDFLDGMKRPAGVFERFDASPAAEIFADADTFAEAWQRREFTSLETVIADMRAHQGVSSYVVTEFSDIEWEFNGILDYGREEKAFSEVFARVNAPVLVHLDAARHAYWSGETVCADVVVVNDTAEPFETTLEWDAFDESGSVEVSVPPHGTVRVDDRVAFDAPAVEGLVPETVSLVGDEHTATCDIVVAGVETSGDAKPRVGSKVFVADPLATEFEARGYELVESLHDADVAVVTDGSSSVREFAARGGRAVIVPGTDGRMSNVEDVAFTSLPEDESWNLCASVLFQDALPELDPVPGWAFEELYPYAYVSEVADDDAVSVGYVEGWIANAGGAVVSQPLGEGRVTVCTLRVTDAYGTHPVATTLVDRLVADTV